MKCKSCGYLGIEPKEIPNVLPTIIMLVGQCPQCHYGNLWKLDMTTENLNMAVNLQAAPFYPDLGGLGNVGMGL